MNEVFEFADENFGDEANVSNDQIADCPSCHGPIIFMTHVLPEESDVYVYQLVCNKCGHRFESTVADLVCVLGADWMQMRHGW
ncbi:MAG: hypothetical protein ACREUA_05765 [Burkholderiales bacterium]